MPGLTFPHFFRAPVVKPDLRNRIDNLFPIQLQDYPEHPVGAGMWWSKVEKKEIGILRLGLPPPFGGVKLKRFLFRVLLFIPEPERSHLRGTGRTLPTDGVPFPVGGHQDAAKAGVAFEADSEHVVDFAFIPV